MADDFFQDNIFDKIVTSVYNIPNQFAMKDSSLSKSVGIFYLGVYCCVELCGVAREDKKEFFKATTADRSRQLRPAQRSGK